MASLTRGASSAKTKDKNINTAKTKNNNKSISIKQLDIRCLDGPQMSPGSKTDSRKNKNNFKIHCFVISHHVDQEFSHGALKSESI